MRTTKRHRVLRLGAGGAARERADALAGEEPLEIRLGGEPFTVTMRTPGDDFDLVAGFLVSEGVVREAGHIVSMAYGPGVDRDGRLSYNVVDVRLAAGAAPPAAARNVYTSSSCGVCGTASIDAVVRASTFPVADDPVRVPLDVALGLPDLLRAGQRIFERTGGVHAAGLFTLSDGGAQLVCVREDVGRHNAVDKVVGRALRDGLLPLAGTVLQVSGRASFELVQKAALAGIPVLAAVSAPSALAVEVAAEAGMTLLGFSRGDSVNVYTRADRIT